MHTNRKKKKLTLEVFTKKTKLIQDASLVLNIDFSLYLASI